MNIVDQRNRSARATSPDGKLVATMQRDGALTLTMRPGAYRLGDEERLAHQLERLAALVWVDYRRRYGPAGDAEADLDQQQRDFRNRRADLRAEGSSGDRGVTLETVGLSRWQARVEHDYFAERTEAQVVAALREAAAAVLRDWDARVLRLKDECFDLQLPKPINRPPGGRHAAW